METLKITIDDAQTKELVVRLLHEIKGVTINRNKSTHSRDTAAALKDLSGIWAGREMNLGELRDKAWRRKANS
jgi:hypothetical protein